MFLVAKGNANLLIDIGEEGYLYRCSSRFTTLSENNKYTIQNFDYIEYVIKPKLGNLLCRMELVRIPYVLIDKILQKYMMPDCSHVNCIKVPHLIAKEFHNILTIDHFTKIYYRDDMKGIIWEFKPKWLHQTTKYCRNCTYNTVKGRKIEYCYTKLLDIKTIKETIHNIFINVHIKSSFIHDMINYFHNKENCLQKIFDLQKCVDERCFMIPSCIENVTDIYCLSMTLKDITCFIHWENDKPLKINIIDVDIKPKSKWMHWISTFRELEKFSDKTYH